MSIINAVEDLFKSVYELIASIVSTIYNLILTFVNAIVSFFSGIVNVIVDIFSGAVEIVGGTAKFLLGKSTSYGPLSSAIYRTNCFGRQLCYRWSCCCRRLCLLPLHGTGQACCRQRAKEDCLRSRVCRHLESDMKCHQIPTSVEDQFQR